MGPNVEGQPRRCGGIRSRGVGYQDVRRPDPRLGRMIEEALGDAQTILNVGAGTGSYEPVDRQVVAIQPMKSDALQLLPHGHVRTTVVREGPLVPPFPALNEFHSRQFCHEIKFGWPDIAKRDGYSLQGTVNAPVMM
jgi:hypothetical protein